MLSSKETTAERARVREFLYWMRRLRLQYTGVRWLLAGSIGLDTVAARLKIADVINDLRVVKLGAFDAGTADVFLRALAESHHVELGDEVRRYVVQRAGWPAPFYLQLIFHPLREVGGPISKEHVDRAIEELLSHRSYFDYWRQRLSEELGTVDAEYALALLHHCCRAPDGSTRAALGLVLGRAIADAAVREDKLRYLLDVLENDGYLVEEQQRWRFQSPLLREYWVRRVAPPESDNG